MPGYRSTPIRAVTENAMREAEELGINLDDIARLLEDSHDCARGDRKEGVEERCARKNGKMLKIVIELKTSRNSFQY